MTRMVHDDKVHEYDVFKVMKDNQIEIKYNYFM